MQTEVIRFGEALEKAWKCPATKESHFITPLSLYSKRSYPTGDWDPKGKGKGKGEEKGKDKGRALVLRVKRFVTDSIRASAIITKSTSLNIFATSVFRKGTTH